MSSHKFSGDYNEFLEWRKDKYLHPTRRGRKSKKPVDTPVVPSVANTEAIDSESISGCIHGKDSLLVSPIIDWTEEDVWEFLNEVVRVPHCELYDQGYHRIGCIMCPMSSRKQKLKEMQDFPYVKQKWIEAIKKIRSGGYNRPNLLQEGKMAVGLPTQTRAVGFSYIKLPPPILDGRIRGKAVGRFKLVPQWLQEQENWNNLGRTTEYGTAKGFQMAPRLTA